MTWACSSSPLFGYSFNSSSRLFQALIGVLASVSAKDAFMTRCTACFVPLL
jgi:hypothetical protein